MQNEEESEVGNSGNEKLQCAVRRKMQWVHGKRGA